MNVTLRVRPGMTHGVRNLEGGDLLTVPEDEALALLAAFGDKLERVSEPDSPVVAVSEETAGVQVKPSRLRHRKPEDM